MPEAGGTTTQSGILYQNSVAALFLGRLCDAAPRPDRERIVRIRVEAPALVDDIVVSFADEHNLYIQAKENVRAGDDAWKQLWSDFAKQFRQQGFQQGSDRLAFYTGTVYDEHHVTRELCERARGKDSYAEWWNSLNAAQQEQVTRLRLLVEDVFTDHETLRAFMGNDNIRDFFASIDVVIWTRSDIEKDLIHSWMPLSNQVPWAFFRLLRDRIGQEARIRRAFTAPNLRNSLHEDGVELRTPIDVSDLHAAVRACGALLRQHKHTIADTGRHLRRGIVDNIVNWLRDPSDEQRVSLLLDQAGMGKTVVMRDILCDLENDDVTVLAIKADQQLSGISSYADLAAKLQLPEPVERAVQRLSIIGPVVILIDQIDALSLSLARDQAALNIVLELIARLRMIPSVRILLSCRTFDYRTDPKLKQIDARTPFQLTPLSDEEIKDILQSANIRIDDLLNHTLQLLRTPLHLDLYVQVFGRRADQLSATRAQVTLTSLQDLYHLLWDEIVLKLDRDAPPDAERVEVLQLLTDYMECEQQTSVPRSLLLKPEHHHLQSAARWLASAGILLAAGPEWTFLHQTFFDYCYARQFVEAKRNLAETVRQSDQGLRTRPQMIQVLAYLRGRHSRQYLQSMSQLFGAEGLRYHLKDLLIQWFGALAFPSPEELTLARRLLQDTASRPLVLAAMGANPDWLARLSGTPLQSLLALNDEAIDQEVIPYLASLIDLAQPEVVTVLKPYLGRNDAWNRRIAWILLRVRRWHSVEAADLLEKVFSLLPDMYSNFLYEFHEIAQVFPLHACRFIRAVFDQVLNQYQVKRQEALQQRETQDEFSWIMLRLQPELEHLNNHAMAETLTIVCKTAPDYFVQMILPWLERVLTLNPVRPNEQFRFGSDELDSGWYDDIYPVGRALIQSLIEALVNLGQTSPELFRQYTNRLARLPFDTPQRLLAKIYQAIPEAYATEALQFLLADWRRFNLGELGNQYDSRQIITALCLHLNNTQQATLEEAILSWTFDCPPRDLHDLAVRGIHQLTLLQAIPKERLTALGRRYLCELERKFPNFKASDDLGTSHGGFVESPIDTDSAQLMSDRDWLRAIGHYSGNKSHREFLKGGAQQLSGVLQGLIKEQPERFYQLLNSIPDNIDDAYVTAYINALAESNAPVEWFFEVIRRFGRQPNRSIAITIFWSLAKRSEAILPDDIRAILEDSVYGSPDSYELSTQRRGKELYNAYLNSERGTAYRALMGFLRHRIDDERAVAERWRFVEFASTDPSLALRSYPESGIEIWYSSSFI